MTLTNAEKQARFRARRNAELKHLRNIAANFPYLRSKPLKPHSTLMFTRQNKKNLTEAALEFLDRMTSDASTLTPQEEEVDAGDR